VNTARMARRVAGRSRRRDRVNLIVSGPGVTLASITASRSEPGPASFVLVTLMALSSIRLSSGSACIERLSCCRRRNRFRVPAPARIHRLHRSLKLIIFIKSSSYGTCHFLHGVYAGNRPTLKDDFTRLAQSLHDDKRRHQSLDEWGWLLWLRMDTD